MREYLRMTNVSADSGEGAPLHDFYLNIYEGQILFVTGIHWSGKPTLKSVLMGETAVDGGFLSMNEKIWNSSRFDGTMTMSVDTSSRFCQALTIQENIFSLQKGAWFLNPSDRKKHMGKIRELLCWAEVERDPGELVRNLTKVECTLLWLALARQRDVRLVILDCKSFSYSVPELKRIGKVLQKLKEEGRAVVIMDERPNALLDVADRAAVLRHGTIAKVLYAGEWDTEMIFLHMTGKPQIRQEMEHFNEAGESLECIRDLEGESVFSVYRKQIIGIMDVEWDTDENMPSYLQNACEENAWQLPQLLTRSDTVFVPESSGDSLFQALDIGGNIALTASSRFAGKMGILRPGMKRFLRMEFARKFEIDGDVTQVDELTCRERKLLSIYRLALTRPRVMMLENPMMRISLEDRAEFKAYLRELADEGGCLLVSSKEMDTLRDLCDQILIFRNHKFQDLIQGN